MWLCIQPLPFPKTLTRWEIKKAAKKAENQIIAHSRLTQIAVIQDISVADTKSMSLLNYKIKLE